MLRSIPAALLVLAATAATAQADHRIPADIKVPDGHKKFLVSHAEGVQIYTCSGQAWTFVAPRATLYDDRGRKRIGTHFAGPTWQTKDGSAVVAVRANGVKVDPTAIDWLLLSTTSTTPGRLGRTSYIQRINTTGGLAPAAAGCHAGTAGATAEVPYTADYVFWKAHGGGGH